MVEQDQYYPHQPKGAETKHGGAPKIEEVVDEVTGELLPASDTERVVLEGKGTPGKRPRRTIRVSPKNKKELLRLAGKTEAEDKDQIVPEHFLETLKQAFASEKKEN